MECNIISLYKNVASTLDLGIPYLFGVSPVAETLFRTFEKFDGFNFHGECFRLTNSLLVLWALRNLPTVMVGKVNTTANILKSTMVTTRFWRKKCFGKHNVFFSNLSEKLQFPFLEKWWACVVAGVFISLIR